MREDRQTYGQTDRHTDTLIAILRPLTQTCIQADGHTDRRTDTHTC